MVWAESSEHMAYGQFTSTQNQLVPEAHEPRGHLSKTGGSQHMFHHTQALLETLAGLPSHQSALSGASC